MDTFPSWSYLRRRNVCIYDALYEIITSVSVYNDDKREFPRNFNLYTAF